MSAPHVTLRHRTVYRFEKPVRLGPQQIRLHPAPAAQDRVRHYALAITPEPATLHWSRDALANRIARATFRDMVERLEIEVTLGLTLTSVNPFDFILEPGAARWPLADTLAPELAPYGQQQAMAPWLATLLTAVDLSPQPTISLLVALNQLVHRAISYHARIEPGVQAPAETVGLGSGSCRDMAWLLVQTARALGFAARFTSGYLVQLVDPAHPVPGLDRDRLDLHAWAEVFLPGAGWIGLDATSGLITGAGHVPLASAAQPDAAAAVEGTVEAGKTVLETSMEVTRT